MSDNGSQMIAGHTRKFTAMVAIAQHFGRPLTPTDQAWIESLNGTIKTGWPHLLAITDLAILRAELDVVQAQYNGARLHSGIGYVTPPDEHEGRGETIRQARREGLARAARQRPVVPVKMPVIKGLLAPIFTSPAHARTRRTTRPRSSTLVALSTPRTTAVSRYMESSAATLMVQIWGRRGTRWQCSQG